MLSIRWSLKEIFSFALLGDRLPIRHRGTRALYTNQNLPVGILLFLRGSLYRRDNAAILLSSINGQRSQVLRNDVINLVLYLFILRNHVKHARPASRISDYWSISGGFSSR